MPQPVATPEGKTRKAMTAPPPRLAMEPVPIGIPGVTAREGEIVGWVARGLTSKAIASELQISARTVQKHLERMFKKLGVRSRSALVARAYLSLARRDN